MSGTLLTTGYETVLGKAIVDAAQENSFSVAATVEPGNKPKGKSDSPLIIEWNRAVMLSAQNVLLAAANTLGAVGEVIITYDLSDSTTASLSPIHELGSLVLDTEIDRRLKCQVHLLKEALRYFTLRPDHQTRGISFVMASGGAEVLSPLHALTASAFMRLAQSSFNMYQNEPYNLRGFHTGSVDAASFGRFIVDAIVTGARDGRWYRYSGSSFPEVRFPRK